MIAAALVLLKSLSWQTWLVVGLAIAGGLVYAEKTGHIDLLEHQLASMTSQRDGLQNEIDGARALAVKEQAEQQTKARQTAADEKESANEAQRMSIHARDDSSAAVAALAGLLSRATAAARGGQAAASPSAAGASAPDDGAGLRTNLLGSVGDEAIRYARIADEARIAGSLCAADYDAVAKPMESERGDDDKP